ncbi:MAG: hypothetical protein HYZ54_09350 [Ignavibacteriae bacterium]|nr:hypothetical protein [Ignavibacteriota bacterium]
MKRFIIILILTVLSISALYFYNNPPPRNYERFANKITANVAKKLKEEHDLHLVGIGGRMMYSVEMMSMRFDYYHQITLEEARKLLVIAIKEYLSAINSDEKIRPYLKEYPFTAKNVEIGIFILQSNGSKVPPDKIYYISNMDDILSYYIAKQNGFSTRTAICEESYEEALQLLGEPLP